MKSAARRSVLMASAGTAVGAAMSAVPWVGSVQAASSDGGAPSTLHAPVPIVRLHVDEGGALLGVSAAGELWALAAGSWRRL